MKNGGLYWVIAGGEDLNEIVCHRHAEVADGFGKSGDGVWEQKTESCADQSDRHANGVTVIVFYLVWKVHQDSFHVGNLLPV